MVSLFSGSTPDRTQFEIRTVRKHRPGKVLRLLRQAKKEQLKFMSAKLYVGNLSFNTTETDLQDLFAGVGPVQEVIIMQDRMTMKSRGFGFVTMVEAADGQKAIAQFHGKQIDGRALTVNEARPKEERAGSGGGGYGGGGQRSYGNDRNRGGSGSGGGYSRR